MMGSHVETVIDVEQIQDVGSVNKLFHDVLAQERRIQVWHHLLALLYVQGANMFCMLWQWSLSTVPVVWQ